MKKIALYSAALVAAFAILARAAEHKGHHAKGESSTMIELAADDIKWGGAPAGLPEGARGSVLEGDPSKGGYFAVRLKVPAGYRIAPHTHPGVERVTVLEGELSLGMGKTWDESALKALGPGAYVSLPKGHEHFAYFKKDSTIQLASIGPWGITYLDPKDDPRKATKGR